MHSEPAELTILSGASESEVVQKYEEAYGVNLIETEGTRTETGLTTDIMGIEYAENVQNQVETGARLYNLRGHLFGSENINCRAFNEEVEDYMNYIDAGKLKTKLLLNYYFNLYGSSSEPSTKGTGVGGGGSGGGGLEVKYVKKDGTTVWGNK